MDTVGIIAAALAAGAAASRDLGAQPTASQEYRGLKEQIEASYPGVAFSIKHLEAAPDSNARRAVLEEELAKAGASGDDELTRQALALLRQVRSNAPATGANIGVNLDTVIAAGDIHIHDISVTTVYQLPETKVAYEAPPAPGVEEAPPEPGMLPPGSRLPFGRNALFIGRSEDLQTLARLLLHGDSRVVVMGWGGVGKTQLAVEFAHRYGRFFAGGVFWLTASAEDTLRSDLAQCGLAMGLQPWPDKQPEQIAAVLRAWQGPEQRLVVLDNLEEATLARTWLPQLGGGVRPLVTARRTRWPADLGLTEHWLGVLAREESLALMRRLAPRLAGVPDDALGQVAERLGDLPLAVDLASRYLADRPALAPAGYLAELERAGALVHTAFVDWTAEEDLPTTHETNMATTFLLSWRQLGSEDAADRLAARLFRAAAFCAPNAPVPRSVFYRLQAGEEAQVDRALQRLAALGLLGPGQREPLIHPLLAEFGRRLETEVASPLPELAESLGQLAVDANQEMDDTGQFAAHRGLWPHVRAVAGWAEPAAPEAAGLLWNELGRDLCRMADFTGARAAFACALAIDEAAYDPDHPNVGSIVNNLGSVLRDLGDLAGARAACERALAIDEAAYGPDHPNVGSIVNNLGGVLQAQGDLAGARAAYERALAIDEAAYGPDHPDVATDVNNLGGVLRDLGDLAGARAAFERALAIDEAAYGPDHPDVATDVNNLGGVLRDLGDLAGARAAFERALAIDEAAYGPDHPNVAARR